MTGFLTAFLTENQSRRIADTNTLKGEGMEITMFYMEGCPYCRQAMQQMKEIFSEHPEYAAITVNKLEDTENKELADQYDYYYDPTFFLGKEKLYEADPADRGDIMKNKLEAMFQKVYAKL